MADDFDPDAFIQNFDPDAFLANAGSQDDAQPSAQAQPQNFDPDEFIKNFDPDSFLSSYGGQPKAETPTKTFFREAAHEALPAAAGFASMGPGAAGGAAIGTAIMPGPGTLVGGVLGGIGGMIAGSMATSKAQEAALGAVGFDDSAQRAANAEANPKSSFVGSMAPGLAGMSPGKGLQLGARAAGGGLMAGFEGGQQLSEGKFDPTKLAISAAAGVALPKLNRAGEAVSGLGDSAVNAIKGRIPGRPNVQPNPQAAPVQQAATSSQTPTSTGETAFAQPPPSDQVATAQPKTSDDPRGGATIDVVGSSRDGEKPFAKLRGSGNAGVTQGQLSPDIASALTPEEAFGQLLGPDNEGIPKQTGLVEGAQEQQQKAQQVQQENAAQPVDTSGMEQLPLQNSGYRGEPARVVPQPEFDPDAFLDNFARPVGAKPNGEPAPELHPDVQKISEDAQANTNTEPSAAQIEADNYKKGGGRLFGRQIKIENPRGSTRKSKPGSTPEWEVEMPYDYGDVKGTKGADGDNIDIGLIGTGDKHYVIDQRDPDTGKFDEHKIMAFAKDEADAMDHYARGFSDERGRDRIGAVTEASPEDLKQWLGTKGKKKAPYGDFEEKPVTAAVKEEPTVPEPTIEPIAHEPEPLPAEEPVSTKRAAKYEGLVVKGIKDDNGEPITARTKADAAKKSADVQTMNDAYERLFAGKESDIVNDAARGTPDEREALHAALQQFVQDTNGVTYQPNLKHAPYLMRRAARQLAAMKKPTEKAWQAFASKTADGFSDAVRQEDRIEGDIARNNRSLPEEDQIVDPNTGEDAVIAALDEKRLAEKGEFDIHPAEDMESHVEPIAVKFNGRPRALARPTKTLDTTTPEGRKAFNEEVSRAPVQMKREAGPAPVKSEDIKTEGRKLDVKALPKEYLENLVKQASTPKGQRATTRLDSAEITDVAKNSKSPTVKALADLFNDENGALYAGKAWDDIKNIYNKFNAAFDRAFPRELHKTYRARQPATPQEEYANSMSNGLHRLGQNDIQHILDLQKMAGEFPKELNNPKTLERIYHAVEANKTNLLPADEQVLYNKFLKPLADVNDQWFKQIKALKPDSVGPAVQEGYIYRITKGANKYDVWNKSNVDPVEGLNAIRTKSPTQLEREFYALEQSNGTRFVISPTDEGFTIWNNRKPMKVIDPTFSFEEGNPYKVGSRTFTMKQALTPEIEQHALFGDGQKAEYYHNAALSMLSANYYLGKTLRHLEYIGDLKQEMKNKGFAVEPGAKLLKSQADYTPTELANFGGWRLDPRLARELDHYAQPGINDSVFNAARNVSQAVTKTMFWNPTPHARNVLEHWAVERGFRWATPPGYQSLIVDGLKSIKSVLSQDALQRDLRDKGYGGIYGGVMSQGFVNKLVKTLGEDIRDNKPKWDIIARQWGLGPSDLIKGVYKVSQHTMWAINDIALTQAILENERMGMTRDQAIIHAERHIPNYRIPADVMGSKNLSKFLAEPTVNVFGRYHYGMFNSYANITKDLVQGNARSKIDAVGNLLVLGAFTFGVYKGMDRFAQWITGNDKAEVQRRGPFAIPHHIARYLEGKEDITNAARSTLTGPPLATTAVEEMLNRDWRGKPIREPGSSLLQQAGQTAGHLARGLVAPYGTAVTAANRNEDAGTTLRNQLLDVKSPTEKSQRYEQKAPIINHKAAVRRERNTPDFIEQGTNYLNRKLTGGGP